VYYIVLEISTGCAVGEVRSGVLGRLLLMRTLCITRRQMDHTLFQHHDGATLGHAGSLRSLLCPDIATPLRLGRDAMWIRYFENAMDYEAWFHWEKCVVHCGARLLRKAVRAALGRTREVLGEERQDGAAVPAGKVQEVPMTRQGADGACCCDGHENFPS